MITVSILWCLGTNLKCLKWKARQSIAIDRFNQPNVYIFNQIWAEQLNKHKKCLEMWLANITASSYSLLLL